MSTTPPQAPSSEEIDLVNLNKKFGKLFKKGVKHLFEALDFFWRFKFVLLGIAIAGFAYGFYKDKNTTKVYDNEVLVVPNVESVDYLYGKVEALNAKIKLRDTAFLKKVLGGRHWAFRGAEVEPVIDIYNFVSKSRENIDVFRILFQNQDLKDYIQDPSNIRHYKYHRLNFSVIGTENSAFVVQKLMDYLNDSPHYTTYLELGKKNTDFQIEQNSRMIAQIDSIMRAAASQPTVGSTAVAVSSENQLNDLVETRRELLDNDLLLNMKKMDQDAVIKEVNTNYNVQKRDGFYLSKKVKTPLFWLFLFCFIFFVRYSYRKLKAINEAG